MNGWMWFAWNHSHWLGPLLIAIGGACGAAARFVMAEAMKAWRPTSMPWGTMMVNILGSFIIGMLTVVVSFVVRWMSAAPQAASGAWMTAAYLLLATGFCGGFTTFSTATVESVTLARNGRWREAIASVAITLVATVFAVTLGAYVGAQLAIMGV